jgi:hypothetical protein
MAGLEQVDRKNCISDLTLVASAGTPRLKLLGGTSEGAATRETQSDGCGEHHVVRPYQHGQTPGSYERDIRADAH